LSSGRLLDAAEVAQVLGISVRRVYAIRDQGLIHAIKIGRSLRFAPSDLMDLLEAGRDLEAGTWL
jgi:excisionase family DNA binding protein